MLMAGNLGQEGTYGGGYPFVNLATGMRYFIQASGSGSFSQHCGELSAAVTADEFTSYITDNGIGLPSGVYRVLNPTGATIRLTDTITDTGFVTTTDFSYTYTTANTWYFQVRGSLRRHSSTAFAILKPGTYTAFAAGDIWDATFINFLSGLSLQCIRFMDWGSTVRSLETDWTDTTPANAISYDNLKAGGIRPPIAVMCNLANRLNVAPWFCIPTRATQDYASAMAAEIVANLTSTLRSNVRIEYANEIWNYAGLFGEMTRWVEFGGHTRYTATWATGSRFTRTAHGLTAGIGVRVFKTRENRAAIPEAAFPEEFLNGNNVLSLSVVDTNTFMFMRANGTTVTPATGQVNLIFIRDSQTSVVADMDLYYSNQSLAFWNTIDPILGTAGYKHVIATQAAGLGHAQGRLSVSGVLTRMDELAIAPYLFENWYYGEISIDSGQLTPKLWGNASATAYISLYTASAQPSPQNVIDGVGAGFIASSNRTLLLAGEGSFSAVTAITGLANGTAYKVAMVIAEGNYHWYTDITATVSGVSSKMPFPDTYDNQAMRHRLSIPTSRDWLIDHVNLIASHTAKAVTCYEGGSHFDEAGAGSASAWQKAYLETTAYAEMLRIYFNTLAANGCELFAYFVTDVLHESFPSSWKIADSYSDTSDAKYVMFKAFSGGASVSSQLSLANRVGTNYSTSPGAYPANICAFSLSAAPHTYVILAGNSRRNFTISAQTLQLANDTSISWGTVSTYTITILGSDSKTEDLFDVTFQLGAGGGGGLWYESDAIFAWDSTTDTGNTAIDAVKGFGMLLASGAGATIASGLWNNGNGTRYERGPGLSATIDLASASLFFGFVANKGSASTNFQTIVRIGVLPMIQAYRNNANIEWYLHNGTLENGISGGSLDATTRVYWYCYDQGLNKVFYGYNQTLTNPAGSAGETPVSAQASTIGTYIFSPDGTSYNYGSIQVVNRAGLNCSAALAIAQKMQTLHGL